MLFGMQETMIYKDVMIKGRRCPEIGCTETYAHCYMALRTASGSAGPVSKMVLPKTQTLSYDEKADTSGIVPSKYAK